MKEKNKAAARKVPSYKPLLIFILLSPYLIGLYHEWLSCLAAVFLIGYLVYCRVYSGELLVPKSLTMAACCIVTVFFAVSPIWAVDSGMAVFGFIKFLPLPLFALAAAQVTCEQRHRIIDMIPLSGAVMTVLSAALSLIPFLRQYLLVSDRLGGFFQYPNAFAIFLLIGIAIQLYGKPLNIRTAVICSVLLLGIFATGSRTVFLLMIAALVVYVVITKNKKTKLLLVGGVAAAIAVTAVYALITGNLDTISRYLTSSFTSSTFVGRLLYYIDALPVILRNPLGLGYMGYYFTQGSFQTGVYSVFNIHNELLQIFLDIGWIPAAACVAALVIALKKCGKLSRVIIILLVAHSLLDFDLQFLCLDFILILTAECDNKKHIKIKSLSGTGSAAVLLAGLSIYFGIANTAYYFNFYDTAVNVYPAYTTVYIAQISEAGTAAEMEALADRILSLNESVSIAYSAKARTAFSQGDILNMIEYKKQAISLAKYSIDEYEDYYELLNIAAELYENAGDEASEEYCRKCINEIPQMLKKVEENTSPLGWMIDDKPELEWEH